MRVTCTGLEAREKREQRGKGNVWKSLNEGAEKAEWEPFKSTDLDLGIKSLIFGRTLYSVIKLI